VLEKLTSPIALVKNCELSPPNQLSISPNSPPSNSIAHPVKEGENLISIANRSEYQKGVAIYRAALSGTGLLDDLSDEMANARAVIHFNFGTTVSEYVNWYLLNITCCYHATEDRTNRRFSNHDATSRSPVYGVVGRAGKIYLPTDTTPPPPKTPADVRPVKMWARLAFQDGMFSWLNDMAKVRGAGSVDDTMAFIENVLAGHGYDWDSDELAKIAKIRKFAKPLRRALPYLKKAGWALTAADIVLGGRVVQGYLVMSYQDEFDTHYSWEVNMTLKGSSMFSDAEGAFTTNDDKYTIRTSVFNPAKWGDKDLSCTMTGGGMGFTIENAFRRAPHAGSPSERAFTYPSLVLPNPGALDWTLKLTPKQAPGGGLAFYHTVPGCEARLSNGRLRSFITIMSV
jgi:hypothetical protein